MEENRVPARSEKAEHAKGSGSGRYRGQRLQVPEKRGFWKDYGYLLVTAVVVLVLFRVVLQLAWVPSSSMETTVPTKSLMICWKLPYALSDPAPQRGDVVTFWDEELGKLLVKRIIGLPGDTVTFDSGYVYINGEKLNEDYLPKQGITQPGNRESYQVPEGHLLMMGDNRTGSLDSRYWDQPYVPIENVRAHVMLCISLRGNNSWRGVHLIK